MMIEIKLQIEWGHGANPNANIKSAVDALKKVVDNASVDRPALGGELKDACGNRMGSYIVEFK